jgi:hypothetical protein
MFKSKTFDTQEHREWLRYFPQRNRRWNVTIFRNEAVQGGINQIVVHQYENVRSIDISTGRIVNHEGVLHFIDADEKEVVARSVPFMVTEVAPAPEELENSEQDAQPKN